mgnify:CR=1 FL=1
MKIELYSYSHYKTKAAQVFSLTVCIGKERADKPFTMQPQTRQIQRGETAISFLLDELKMTLVQCSVM